MRVSRSEKSSLAFLASQDATRWSTLKEIPMILMGINAASTLSLLSVLMGEAQGAFCITLSLTSLRDKFQLAGLRLILVEHQGRRP